MKQKARYSPVEFCAGVAGLLLVCFLSEAVHARDPYQPQAYGTPTIVENTATDDPQTDDSIPHTVEQWKAYIKASYCHYFDFIKAEDGTPVYCKRYQDWQPADLRTLKKYAPNSFQFFIESASTEHFGHKGHEVLEEFLPDYYKKHGGVNAFRRDILALG